METIRLPGLTRKMFSRLNESNIRQAELDIAYYRKWLARDPEAEQYLRESIERLELLEKGEF